MTFISIVLSILKAIPIIDSWFQQIAVARIAELNSENIAAIKKALTERDQRDLEEAIGNPNPGMPSGDPGTVIQKDRPPGT